FNTYTVDGALAREGQLTNGTDGNGMKYKVKVVPQLKGGRLDIRENTLTIENATEVILFISAATDFMNEDFESQIEKELNSDSSKFYVTQREDHIAQYSTYFDRVEAHLGTTNQTDLITNKRLENFITDRAQDDALAALFHQFGRYL